MATSTTATAQLQTGFHYKIKDGYCANDGKAPVIRYTATVKKQTVPLFSDTVKVDTLRKASVKQKGDTLLIEFWAFSGPATSAQKNLSASSGTSPERTVRLVRSEDLIGKHRDTTYFYHMQIKQRQSISSPIWYISLPYAATEIGVATVPYKYRFGNTSKLVSNQLLSSISLGPYIGRKWGRTRFYTDKDRTHNSAAFSLAFMLTPTVIAIDSTNTRRDVKTKSDEMGITTAFAAMYSYRDVNAGFFLGFDHPVTGRSDKWIYASKPWIGFGFGYKINILGAKE